MLTENEIKVKRMELDKQRDSVLSKIKEIENIKLIMETTEDELYLLECEESKIEQELRKDRLEKECIIYQIERKYPEWQKSVTYDEEGRESIIRFSQGNVTLSFNFLSGNITRYYHLGKMDQGIDNIMQIFEMKQEEK